MKTTIAALAMGACLVSNAARAADVTLTFDELHGGFPNEHPGQIYNGGTGAAGSGPGRNLGITFLPLQGLGDAIAVCKPGDICSNPGGVNDNALFIFGGAQVGETNTNGIILHSDGGFSGTVDFDVSLSDLGLSAVVLARQDSLHDRNLDVVFLDNAVQNRAAFPDVPCGRSQCPFVHYTVSLALLPPDTLAHDLFFQTRFSDSVQIDNVHFSNLVLPTTGGGTGGGEGGAVPEPAAWALMIAGFGVAGSALRRRRERVRA